MKVRRVYVKEVWNVDFDKSLLGRYIISITVSNDIISFRFNDGNKTEYKFEEFDAIGLELRIIGVGRLRLSASGSITFDDDVRIASAFVRSDGVVEIEVIV